MTDLAAFKAAIDIVSVAELLSDGEVRRKGHGGTMVCAFHDERNPSCTLYDDGSYHCFVCRAHGDVIALTQRLRGDVSFGDALDWLADQFSLERPARSPEATARAAALRAIKVAMAEGREGASLPADLTAEVADKLGLGRAVDLAEAVTSSRSRLLEPDEAVRWEGAWTLALETNLRSGVTSFGAFLAPAAGAASVAPEGEEEGFGDPDEDPFAEPALAPEPALDPLAPGVRFVVSRRATGVVWAGLGIARSSLAKHDTLTFTPDPAELLSLAAQGVTTAVSPGRRLDAEVAASAREMASRLVVVATPERLREQGFASACFAAVGAGLRVELATRRPEGLAAPVPLFAYVARRAEQAEGPVRGRLLDAYLAAVPSPSSRALYRAELASRGLVPA